MAKLWILAAVCVAALVQVTLAKYVSGVVNNEPLTGYEKFLAKHTGSDKEVTEAKEFDLKAETLVEMPAIVEDDTEKFKFDFSQYVASNDDIHTAIELYQSMLSGAPEHKDEIEKIIATFENLLKETDLKKKTDEYLAVEKNFSPEFRNFLRHKALRFLSSFEIKI